MTSAALPLVADNLSVVLGRRAVLSGVHLTVRPGAGATGLVGPNGSGKTTFLRACLGLVEARGNLQLYGETVGSRASRENLRLVGWVPQQRGSGTLRLTVRELVSLGLCSRAGLLRPLSADDWSAVDRSLETAGLSDLAGRVAQELSGGQWQRASIARALAAQPRLLLLDEPTTHLDRDSRRSVLSLLERLAEDPDLTMVLVSHDETAWDLCGQFFAFSAGTVRETVRGELERE